MTFENFCANFCIYKHQDKRNEEPCINCPAEAWADKMEDEGECMIGMY